MGAGERSAFSTGRPVRAVLFDYGLTLVSFERPRAHIDAAQIVIADRIEAGGHRRPDVVALRAAVHDRVEAAVTAHEATGALEEVDVTALERAAFADIGLRLGDELLDACSEVIQAAWFHGVHPYPDVRGSLTALRRMGLRLGVCSNAAYRPASMHAQLRHVGIANLVDGAVFSSEVGWRKPSPHMYAAALGAVGADADETVFVGDRVREDVDGARDAGMRTVLIVRDASPADVDARHRRADAVTASLAELPALLEPKSSAV